MDTKYASVYALYEGDRFEDVGTAWDLASRRGRTAEWYTNAASRRTSLIEGKYTIVSVDHCLKCKAWRMLDYIILDKGRQEALRKGKGMKTKEYYDEAILCLEGMEAAIMAERPLAEAIAELEAAGMALGYEGQRAYNDVCGRLSKRLEDWTREEAEYVAKRSAENE